MANQLYQVVAESTVFLPARQRQMASAREWSLAWFIAERRVNYQTNIHRFSGKTPKEQALIRAYLYLVELYRYPMNCIGVRARISARFVADLLVYTDETLAEVYMVVEGAPFGSSNKRLLASLDRAVIKARYVGAPYAAVMSGGECIAVRITGPGTPTRIEYVPTAYNTY